MLYYFVDFNASTTGAITDTFSNVISDFMPLLEIIIPIFLGIIVVGLVIRYLTK